VPRTVTPITPVEIVRSDGPIGLGAQAHISRVEFATINAVPCQIDGEVLHLAPDSGLIIDCAPHAVATVARTPT
jgi:hypothetical protein